MKKYTQRQIRFIAIRTLGNFLVLSSLFGIIMTFGPAVKNELVYRYERAAGIEYVVEDIGADTDGPFDNQPQKPTESFGDVRNRERSIRFIRPVDTDFGIVIPKIAANASIVPDVDPSDYDGYIAALAKGVAHAYGTYFPGEGGNIYLFSHSTDNFWNVGRYNAIFYLLKELEVGDEINLYRWGRRYIYKTVDKRIVEPTDVSYLTEPTDSEQLTLQTCWPPGTTFKRLIVIAKPLSAISAN